MREVVIRPSPLVPRLWGLARQFVVIIGLEKIYEVSRGTVPRQSSVALTNGLKVVRLEKTWHIFDEWKVQAIVFKHAQWYVGPLVLDRTQIISAVNHFYLYSHFLSTLAFLIWLYLWRRPHFPFVRDIIFVTTALALVSYIAFPMMPPRLMGAHMHIHGYQFKDTLTPLINYKLQQTQLTYNPYAAMPSLHFAWALILGTTLVLIGRNPLLRLIGLLYPVMMLATILVSGNHLLLDAVGSAIVVTIAAIAVFAAHQRPHIVARARRMRRMSHPLSPDLRV